MIRIDPAQLENTDVRDVLKYLIAKYSPAREQRLRDYYEGRHDILNRQMADPAKPNNKIVCNLCAYITNVLTGYFMGQPVVYSADGEENDGYVETLKDIFDLNDEQDHNAELGKGQSIAGVDYELLYLDEEARIRFTELPTENVIYVESDDIDEKPLMAVRVYETDNIKQPDQKLYYYEVYTDSEIITYTAQRHNENVSLTEMERQPHYFGEVPIIQYCNNEEKLGDFEGVISLIDAYNLAQSDSANDFQYFTDAYLLMVGAKLGGGENDPTGDVARATMRETRIIELPDKDVDAKFLIKDINDTAIENYKNRLRKDIHTLAKVPDLSDESFSGNLTGVAISYKIWGMDQIVSVKERKFINSLLIVYIYLN
jgi:SPP1 family phage portal protein